MRGGAFFFDPEILKMLLTRRHFIAAAAAAAAVGTAPSVLAAPKSVKIARGGKGPYFLLPVSIAQGLG